MYLLKHIYTGVHSVINHLIVMLVLTTSACLFSFSAYSGTNSKQLILPGITITANNGHVNTGIPNHRVNGLRIREIEPVMKRYNEIA
jgi:hypothetical protein